MNGLIYFNFLISLSIFINENNPSCSSQYNENIVYQDGQIKIIGFSGAGKIIKVRELKYYVFNLEVDPSNIYILRIYNNGIYKSFKFTVP